MIVYYCDEKAENNFEKIEQLQNSQFYIIIRRRGTTNLDYNIELMRGWLELINPPREKNIYSSPQ